MKKGFYRTIHSCIWADKKFNALSDQEKLVWFHLLTNPFTNGIGIYSASMEGLAAHKRWPIEQYRACFAVVSAQLGILYDDECQVFYIKNFFRYNKPANPNTLTGILKMLKTIPDCDLRDSFLTDLQTFGAEWGEGFANVIANVRATL